MKEEVYTISFGKYNGVKITKVPKTYLLWLSNHKYKLDSNPDFVIATKKATEELDRSIYGMSFEEFIKEYKPVEDLSLSPKEK